MKNAIKFILSGILINILAISLSQCSSPFAPKKATAMVVSDTLIVLDTLVAASEEEVASAAPADAKVLPAPLTLVISNLDPVASVVTVGVYGTENKFPSPKDQLKEYKFKAHGKKLVAKIKNLPFGVYALAIYQDVNSNGKIDKNVVGIPIEPYAFSNNYKPIIKAPGFDNCKFQYNDQGNTVSMNMIQ